MKSAREILARLRYALRASPVRTALTVDATLLASLLSIASLYWWPSVQGQRAAEHRVDEVRRSLTAAMQANELASAYASTARTAEIVERKLQAAATQAQLVQALSALSRKHDVRIISEAYEEGRRQQDYTPLFLQVTVQGRYSGVRSLLNDVSALPLWVEVEEARLERLRERASVIKAQLRLRVVRRNPATAASES